MAATKLQKNLSRPSHPQAQSPAISPPPDPAVNGKKKKKKKGRARGSDPNAPAHFGLADEDDDLPQLEHIASSEHRTTSPRSLHRTGLSPELESVHLSTTAALSASAATRLNASSPTQAELLATANDLYRRMDSDPMVDDDDYWASLPSHIKNFVKMTYSQSTNPNANQTERTKAQSMFAIAQQMIQSGAGRASPKGGQTQPPGAYPSSIPFDPSIFSDPAFNLAMEQTLAASGPLPPAPGQPPRGPLPPTNVVLLNEFGSEEQQQAEEDYYSEDEVDENVDDPDDGTNPAAFIGYDNGVFGSTGDRDLGGGETGKKKSKKKKKKGGAQPLTPNPLPVTTAPPPPAPNPNPPTPLPAPTHPMPASRPPPVAHAHPAPLTSSRAAGKQPMSYSAPAPAAAPPPSRTSRAASKAPLPAHAYPHAHHHPSPPSSQTSGGLNKARPAAAAASTMPKNNKLWSTNSTEERERIKEFWLGLGEDERRALVKVEKEAVLKKMKEQQKHSCSCAVCGRKRNAIEEELEVLYDAYYEELEQYANHQQQYASSGGTIPPPPGPGPFPGSVELDKNGAVVGGPHHHGKNHHPSSHPPRTAVAKGVVNGVRKKTESEFDDEDAEEDEYEDEEEYEEDDEEEEEEEEDAEEDAEEEDAEDKRHARRAAAPPPPRSRQPVPNGAKPNSRDDFFNFGNSLTVAGPGNILTVADDLLKNDGQKFLEMMEQLAERRMQREEEAAAEVGMDSEDDEDDEDGDEDDDDEDDDEDEDEEEEEVMTEEQKMEEGKRMFSIFAARMFEQRVLQAYREKVAQERQLQLLRELEDEDKAAQEKEAKKQKENQKKKAKKQLQKQAKEEERKQREAEKAAEEAALKAKQEAHEEELRKKREEERVRREALRKAQEEDRARKEEERRKRVAEEKERHAEQERKRKEREERLKAERREREEKERKAKEEKDARIAAEKAAVAAKREQQEKEEREKRLQREAEERKEREARERLQRERANASKARGAPSSPRNATGGPSRGTSTVAPKKILTKPPVPAATSSSTSPAQPTPRQPPQRPAIVTQAQNPVAPQPQYPSASSSNVQSPAPSTTPISVGGYPGQFPSPGNSMPSAMSPRSAALFSNGPPAPPFVPYGPASALTPGQGLPPPPLGPSTLPRGFQVGPTSGFDSFQRPLGPPAAIGPPQKGLPNPPGSPIGMFNPVPGPSTSHLRRGSVQDRPNPANSFGVVQRPIAPIAPIARPSISKEEDKPSGSPKAKSASPSSTSEGVLGSSALVADDDEPILPQGRRVVAGAVGQGWGTPQTDPRAGWTSQNMPFTPPGRAPNGMWGGGNTPEQWQGGFPQHSPFGAPYAAPSPPPGNSS